MRRRDFLAVLSGAATAWPRALNAQQSSFPTIGFLSPTSADGFTDSLRAFKRGLSEQGYVDGRNVGFEYRWADDKTELLPTLAAELVRLQPALIVTASGSATAAAAKSATQTIPVVFAIGADPVKLGFAASFNRPGGNMTGFTVITVDTVQKRMEILQQILPNADTFALLIHSNNPNVESYTRDVQDAAQALQRKIDLYKIANANELDDAFAALAQRRIGGIVLSADPIFTHPPDRPITLAKRHAIPTLFPYRELAAAGGLASYGPKLSDGYRLMGSYAGRILKGEKPGDLPIQQFNTLELVINLRTAQTLGLTVPISLLGRADEVIE